MVLKILIKSSYLVFPLVRSCFWCDMQGSFAKYEVFCGFAFVPLLGVGSSERLSSFSVPFVYSTFLSLQNGLVILVKNQLLPATWAHSDLGSGPLTCKSVRRPGPN